MLIGVVGNEFDYNMGNLKTYTLTTMLYTDFKAGNTIYSTYELGFPHKKITCMGSLIKILKEMKNVSIGMDEMHVFFDAYGGASKKTGTWYLKEFVRQTRKRNVRFYFTSQTFNDVHKSIRRMIHTLFITEKLHPDMSVCLDDSCHEDHLLHITHAFTGDEMYFKVNKNIFELYNSDEVVEWEN